VPDAELRRQRAAYRRGLLRATALYGTISLVTGALAVVAFRENRRGNVLLGRYRAAAIRAGSEAGRANRGEHTARLQAARAENERGKAETARRKAEQARIRMERLADERRKLQLLADAARIRADDNAAAATRAAGRAVHAEGRARSEAENAHGQLYIAQMSLMQQASDAGNIGRARELLEAQVPPPGKSDLRDFEWRLFWQRCSSGDLVTLRGHKGSVAWADYAPGGRTLATSGFDHTIRLWDVLTHRQLAVWDAHKNWVTCVAFSPDGQTLASSGDDGQVVLWSVARREMVRSFQCRKGEWPSNLVWSPQGDRLTWCTTTGGLYTAHPTAEKARRTAADRTPLLTVAYSPDGKTLVCAGLSPRLHVFDARTLDRRQVVTDGIRDVWRLVFSPDGRRLASSGHEGLIQIWDPAQFRVLQTLKGHQLGVGGLAFSPDSTRLVSGSFDQTVRLWDVADGTERISLTGHTGLVGCVRFAPDGRTVISGSADTTARIWDAAALPNTRTVPPEARTASALAVSRRGRLAAIGNPNDEGSIQVWDPLEPAGRRELRAPRMGRTEALALSPDDCFVAAADRGRLRIWDLRTGSLVTVQESDSRDMALCFSPDGKLLASVDPTRGRVRFRETRGWRVVREVAAVTVSTTGFPQLVFTADGRTLIANGLDGTLRFCSVSDGRVTGTLTCPGGYVRAFRLSPDGKLLATSAADGSIQLWDVASRRRLGDLTGHKSYVLALAFSPSGKSLLSASEDGTIKFWNLALRQEVVTLRDVGAELMDAEFLQDQQHLITRERRGEVRVYEASALPPRNTRQARR
jgi:WD40 repeat protein